LMRAGVSSDAVADAATIGKHLSIADDIVAASILDMMNAETTRIANAKRPLGSLAEWPLR
jgi:hypothetical protein